MHLDLSYNNISKIESTYFEPIRNELKILNISQNVLTEISSENVGQLNRLSTIDISFNRISIVGPTTFMAARKLKAVYLQNNNLESLSPTMFSSQHRLSFVDFSFNALKTLPERLFQRTQLQVFRANSNRLTEIPVKALNPVQSTLKVGQKLNSFLRI